MIMVRIFGKLQASTGLSSFAPIKDGVLEPVRG